MSKQKWFTIGKRFLGFGAAWSKKGLWYVTTDIERHHQILAYNVSIMKRRPNLYIHNLILFKLKLTFATSIVEEEDQDEKPL